jgi:phosphate-selective porin OprO and OprP
MKTLKGSAVALLATLVVGGAGFASAESIEEIDQRLKVLERKYEIDAENAATKAKTGSGANPSKSFVLKLRGLIQADSRWYPSDDPQSATDQFLLRRIRPTFEGTAFEFFDFRVTPDFANNSATSLFDAYIDVRLWSFAKLRVGKFKPPVGLERLQSGGDLLFVERGFPTGLVPSRDTGVQFMGDVADGAVSYAASLTNGVADGGTGETDTNDGKEGAARVFVHPFKSWASYWLSGFGIGVAGTYADQAVLLPTLRSPGQQQVVTYATGVTANGEKYRIAPQAYWYVGSTGLLAEYTRSSQLLQRAAIRQSVVNEAWQVAVSRVLTGEDASFRSVKPSKDFNPKEGTWGALEVKARIQQLYLDDENFDRAFVSATNSVRKANAYGIGFNWFLNNFVKFQTDYEQTEFDKGATRGDRPTERVIFTRWQLAW